MLHCFQCGTDLPDNLVYCLQCGARLEDEVPTVVDPPIVIPIDPQPVPIDPRPAPVERAASGGAAKFIIGGLVGAGVVIVLLVVLGIVLFSMQGERGQTNALANNKQDIVNAPTPSPTETPKKSTPTPTPTPDNDNTEMTADVRTCDVINPAGGTVNLRRYCDTRDCSLDASTLYIQVEPGDIVETTGRKPVTTGSFTWIQVKYEGEILWISAARINCD